MGAQVLNSKLCAWYLSLIDLLNYTRLPPSRGKISSRGMAIHLAEQCGRCKSYYSHTIPMGRCSPLCASRSPRFSQGFKVNSYRRSLRQLRMQTVVAVKCYSRCSTSRFPWLPVRASGSGEVCGASSIEARWPGRRIVRSSWSPLAHDADAASGMGCNRA